MRAFRIEGDWSFEHLREVELPDPPPPGPGEVTVRLRAASLNYRDLLVPLRGYGRGTGELPLIPLSDGAGEVVAVGEGVSRVAVGDRVCPLFFQDWDGGEPSAAAFATSLGGPIDGVMAELRSFPERGVAKVPAHLSDAEAATLPCAALTAWSAVAGGGPGGGGVRPGDKVLVQGTGGVALFALAFAKLFGAEVTVISSSDAKLAEAKALGADHGLNYVETEDWARASRGITAARGGYDLIVELGGEKTLPLSLKAVRAGGTLALIGVLSGLKLDASLGAVVTRQVRLQGVTVGHRQGFEAMAAAMAQHGLRPVIGKRFGFSELHEAFGHLRSGGGMGKTVLEF